ncbi:hypothetical protein [Xylanimonas ulmi]|uniref:hypothetical protein n=1 Tax=Xylanimonas ulmi TaxID=228973 RepID=UPI0013EE5621|nr:hypothetical protein [Xylanibacterium ulmi]
MGSPAVSQSPPAVEVTHTVETYLRGDNIAGALAVTPGSAQTPAGDDSIRATFYVADASGHKVAPVAAEWAEVGERVTVPGLVGDSDGVSATWNVVVRVVAEGDYTWSADGQRPAGADDDADAPMGTLRITLHQVRQGEGFVPADGDEP